MKNEKFIDFGTIPMFFALRDCFAYARNDTWRSDAPPSRCFLRHGIASRHALLAAFGFARNDI